MKCEANLETACLPVNSILPKMIPLEYVHATPLTSSLLFQAPTFKLAPKTHQLIPTDVTAPTKTSTSTGPFPSLVLAAVLKRHLLVMDYVWNVPTSV